MAAVKKSFNLLDRLEGIRSGIAIELTHFVYVHSIIHSESINIHIFSFLKLNQLKYRFNQHLTIFSGKLLKKTMTKNPNFRNNFTIFCSSVLVFLKGMTAWFADGWIRAGDPNRFIGTFNLFIHYTFNRKSYRRSRLLSEKKEIVIGWVISHRKRRHLHLMRVNIRGRRDHRRMRQWMMMYLIKEKDKEIEKNLTIS